MLLLTCVCVCVFFRLPPAVITAKIQREGEYWKVFKFLHFVTLPSNYTHSSIYIQSSAQWKTKTYAHVCTRTHTRTHKFHLTHKHLQKTITSKIWQTDLCLSYGERGFNACVCVYNYMSVFALDLQIHFCLIPPEDWQALLQQQQPREETADTGRGHACRPCCLSVWRLQQL